MTDPRAKYEAALSAFSTPGGRWQNKGALTYWGKAAGLTADDIIADARAAGVKDRDADIRRGWSDSRTMGEATRGAYTPRAKPRPQPPQHARHVRDLIGDLDAAAAATADWVSELSPCLDWIGKPARTQTAMLLRAAFRPDEYVHILTISDPPAGRMGANIRTAAAWLDVLDARGKLSGDGFLPNPLTGKQGATSDGKPSFIANDCIAAYPFALIEFDAMPLPLQYAFWRGFILTSRLAASLVSVTYSGGKSLHGLLHVGAKTLEDWQGIRERLVSLFASDSTCAEIVKDGTPAKEYPFRCDVQSLRPRQATRLAGAFRRDKGKAQTLLYLNPNARAGTMWREPVAPPPIDPNGKPPCGDAHGAGMCGVCVRLPDCPFADGDAMPGTTLPCAESRTKRNPPQPLTETMRRLIRGTVAPVPKAEAATGAGRCANARAVDAMAAAWCAAGWPKRGDEPKPKLSAEATRVLAAIADRKSQRYDWEYVRRYVKSTGIVPDWLARECRA